ncbi:hypothetical protein IWQ57_001992 [Coemansia nantahalensis]|uniref:Uncharacterized protein n=1 Tax=Coemansia nantahalensis TaxID=2789366 RepID=A0ACC1K2H0_9FUNG|nr:hypothetical protein IWQ57_001992 [Coemansia nantahalensis]
MAAPSTPFGPRPVFPTAADAPAHELPGCPGIVAIDGLLHCAEHRRQVCAECAADHSSHNFIARQLAANGMALPPPNPQIAQAVQRLKTEGNDMFRAQCHFEAAQKYTEALNVAAQRPLWDPSQTVVEESAVLLSNRAACLLALGHAPEAYWDTEVVTRLKRGWGKGHFRMGRALADLGRCRHAALEFQIGHSLDPASAEIKTALDDARQYV